MDNKIFMHFPIEIEKGEDGTYKRVIVKGKASTPHQDKQGEWIDPMGCDIDDFKRISDDHIKGNSGTIGEIIKAHKDHEAVWIDEAELYPSLPQVQHIVKIADELKKRPNSKMQLSFSIEGSATERDSINPKRILKAKLTGAAVTLQPINQNATAELFAKSLNYDDTDFDALEKSDSVEQKRYLYEWKDSDGVEYKLTKSFEIEKGIYIDDAENRKLGRVGKHYGNEEKKQTNEDLSKIKQSLRIKLNDLLLSNDYKKIKNNEWKIRKEIASINDKIKKQQDEINSVLSSWEKVSDKQYSQKTSDRIFIDYDDYDEEITSELKKKMQNKYATELDSTIKKLNKLGIKAEGNITVASSGNVYKEIIFNKSTTAELEDDNSEDVLKKEELKKKTVSLIAKAIEEKRISKEKGKKMLKHFLNQ